MNPPGMANATENQGMYHPFPPKFCPDMFWNQSVVWDAEYPDFSRCFQQTVLVWIAYGFLWMMLPVQGYYILSGRHRIKQWTWVSLLKTIVCCILAALSAMDFCYVASVWRAEGWRSHSDVDLIVPLIKCGTYLLAAVYVYFDRRRARASSGILFVFWLLVLVVAAFAFRTQVVIAKNDGVADFVPFATSIVALLLMAMQFCLACFAEHFAVLIAQGEKPSPEPLASVPSYITFSWFDPMAYKGWKKPLQQTDLWSLVKRDQTKTNVDRLDKFWSRELERSKRCQPDFSTPESARSPKKPHSPSLTLALVKSFWPPMLLAALLRLVQDSLLFVSPQVLRLLIKFVADKSEESWKGYFYAAIMLMAGTAQCFFINHYFVRTSRTGLQIRGAIMASVYRKALRITTAAKRSSNLGEIVNLMSVDAQRLNDLVFDINLLWSAPLCIGVSIFFLWQLLGVSVFAGLGVLILTIPSNVLLARRSKVIQLGLIKEKDARIKITTEILNGMKVLKLYAWEESFEKQVMDVREQELNRLQSAARLEAVSAFNWFVTPFLVSFTTFATYVLISTDNHLDADKVFVALSLLNILRIPLTMLPHIITLFVQSRVAIIRLTRFLTNDELDPNNVRAMTATEKDLAVSIKNGYFSWGKDEPVCLKNINLDVQKGELMAVVGQVGSGKSSLVAAMLGLMEKNAGDVAVRGSVAYVPQQAWIQNLTLRDNILFGKAFDEERYNDVLEACALKPDLALLAAGDETEIGEKGTNLSGGQRQRVSLARAVYSDADVYFLDDPLSAVDAHVGKHIFQHVIGPKGFLRGKTRMLVTHGVGYLPQVDDIVVLSKQQISERGEYDQLLHNNGAFAEFLRTYYLDDMENIQQEDPAGAAMKDQILTQVALTIPEPRHRTHSSLSTVSVSMRTERKIREVFRQDSRLSHRKMDNGHGHAHACGNGNGNGNGLVEKSRSPDEEGKDAKETAGKLVDTETTKLGRVKLDVFHTYLKNATYLAAVGMVGSYVSFNALNIGGSLWLTEWTHDGQIDQRRNDTAWRDYRLGIYGLFGILQASFILSAYLILAYGQIMASRNLHKGMLMRIMRAPMSFFDTTPLGRIVNRFAKDMEIVDSNIPLNLEGVLYCATSVLSTLLVISYSTPIFTPVIIPLAIFYFAVQRFYIASNRQLKRLEAVSRSPIFSHFQESVQGSSVIMATKQGDRFVVENERLVDVNNMSFFLNIISQRWVAIRMDCAGNLVTFFAALFAVLSRNLNWTIRAEDIGLSISYSLAVTQVMNWMVRNVSDLESNVVSVERIKEYSEIPNEAARVIEAHRPREDWPENGHVEFRGYRTRYREGLDLVLRGIDCDIEGGEKIGIVGRTGAGKSSLTLALFRIIEAAGGAIVIDGVNIAELGLQNVRSRITILPQEPVLFSGSLRMNLDPFGKYDDREIWSALQHSHLSNFVSTLPEGLSHMVAEGGENLSVGQRQLICLARALLRKTKILVLDEATAAIDLETDALIQETIRDKFADCTILTIAHRLNTIMDSTRVMVLDQGRVEEFASPEQLLANPKSIFYSLAKSANLAT